MTNARAGATTMSQADEARPVVAPDELRLLVVGPASSRNVSLPRAGFFVIGRGDECDVALDDPSVSRRHARIVLKEGQAQIVDLDSRNGVRVNGVPVRGGHTLAAGDVIGIGDVTLIVRPRGKTRPRRALLSAGKLVARLDQEVERALGYARPLSLLVISLGEAEGDSTALAATLDPVLRPLDIAGRTVGGDVAVILPEMDADEARAAAALLVEALDARRAAWTTKGVARLRVGVASCPADGCDSETITAAAGDSARATGDAVVAGPSERITSLSFGDRTVLLADPAMVRIFGLIERLAVAELPVLVVGETGTGKEHAAFAVHHGSRRRTGTFVPVNCAAIPDALWESELLGHEKGAFSGAVAAKAGLFERADGGTLFLDEVGELSLPAQAKFLRVLETGTFSRVGETRERKADVRIVAATNRDLAAEVKANRFRQDLFYRLGSATVVLPPLRERPTEIPILAHHFLRAARSRASQSPLSIAPDALLALTAHAWPGNVRELRNAMEVCAATVPFGVVERANLPESIVGPSSGKPSPASGPQTTGQQATTFRPLSEELEELEKRRMREALAAASGVRTHAARLIAMPERTFRLKMKQYGLEP